MTLFRRFFVFFGSAAIVAVHGFAGEIEFERDIRPIFSENCTICHGPDDQKGGLRLSGIEFASKKLKSGNVAVVPGHPEKSALVTRINATDPEDIMPPPDKAAPLTEEEKRLLADWISQGADWPKHWAYTKVQHPTPPAVKDNSWITNPIDNFVLARLENHSIAPSPSADNITLIRRLFCDLIGLVPKIEQVDHYLNLLKADSESGWNQLVDDLLGSEHFGERWGRHWLDKARYADSDGYEKDNGRPNAWRYRDWVIDAINNDMPFNQFTIEQFAGDLLEKPTPDQLLATAFNRQTLTNTEGGTDQEQWRVAAIMDRVETMGSVWLGLTLTCSRCHTHKYDEITHNEYYQLFAYFNNGDESTVHVPRSQEEWAHYERAVAEQGEKTKPEINVRVIRERSKDRRATHVFHRGEFKQPGDRVSAGTPEVLPPIEHRAGSEGDRLDLARWLVSGENPLPPRMASNQIWTHLFGKGLVTTLNDFGVRGERPSHPDLLTWLAEEFVNNGWSRKQLIKTIVTSNTYRQASNHRPELKELDPKNNLLARQNRFRVEAEIVRDFSLGVAGILATEVGGPSVFPPIPDGVADVNYNSAFKWKTSPGPDQYRRGIYTYFKRTAPHPNLTTFDCPDSNVTCVQRTRSNTPLAALITLNNVTFAEAARALAKRLLLDNSVTDVNRRIERAFRICLSRPPETSERDRLRDLFSQSQQWYAQHKGEARAFVVADETTDDQTAVATAAWTATLRVLLNLDEFLTRN